MSSPAAATVRVVPAFAALAMVARGAAGAFIDERDRWILWTPVLLGAGIAFYFALASEPPAWLGTSLVAAGAAAAAATILWGGERQPLLQVVALSGLCLAAGFAVAQAQTLMLATRMLGQPVGPVLLQARVTNSERFPDGQRLTLDHLLVDSLASDEVPARARLRLRGNQPMIRPGDEIRLRAMLMPPPPPAIPGGYDFQRQAYFDGFGAVGYSVGRATVLQPRPEQAERDEGLTLWFARLRFVVGERVRAHLQGATAAVTNALLTGEQRAIPETTMEAIRDSGLAHLLSISGLHIGLVAGMVFVVVRSGLALIPWLALRYPIKKWAAIASVLAAGAYTLLADAPVPSQRSFLMVAVVLLAVLVDRQGISMRLVAFAATVILLTQPQAMLGPSFQMSFAAVVGLIAAYEVVQERKQPPPEPPSPLRMFLIYLAGVSLSTMVASLATTPFAAYHFNRFQVWGVAANMVAVPVTGFWIMPWAVVAMLLMPMGWEEIGLRPMGWGVDVVIGVAEEVASWPGSVVLLPPLPTGALALIALGGIWLCLWRRRWRLLGLVPVVAGAAALLTVRLPDVLVAADGKLLAVRTAADGLAFSSKNAGRSARETWLRRSALADAESFWPTQGEGAGGMLRCDDLGCVYRVDGQIVAIASSANALLDDCRLAEVVISLVPIPRPCPAAQTIIDRTDLTRRGAHALWLRGGNVEVRSTDGVRGDRPWVLRRTGGPGAKGDRLAPAAAEGEPEGDSQPAEPAPEAPGGQ